MKYGQIRKYDIANGPGIRTTLFVTGCNFNCKGCFNKEYQDFNNGKEFTDKESELILNYLKEDEIKGLTILGGEPFENVDGLINLIDYLKQEEMNKDIWIYSGYKYEEIIKNSNKLELLKKCNTLVDGRFQIENKDLRLKFRGSSNQRIIDIEKSLINNEIIERTEYY